VRTCARCRTSSWRFRISTAGASWRGVLCAAHCVRQRRESVAGAGRSTAKEMTIRAALGAGAGGFCAIADRECGARDVCVTRGLLLAWSGIHLLIGAAPSTLPRLAGTRIDDRCSCSRSRWHVCRACVLAWYPRFAARGATFSTRLRDGDAVQRDDPRCRARRTCRGEVAIALTLLVGADCCTQRDLSQQSRSRFRHARRAVGARHDASS